MVDDMESTGAGLPDESFLSAQSWMSTIKWHIKPYLFEATQPGNSNNDEVKFIGLFCTMLQQFEKSDQLKRTETLVSIQGMWKNFSRICKF